ncbi:uncharacterized protein LOC135845026 [Planococcus citri]|uniref:uncharacterized protein LOC135845026 n=1 Tax=Planococcus citri TaxID=170843 RepID=UPI0031F744CA
MGTNSEEPFSFLKQSISLQNLAAIKVASTLWQNEYYSKTRSDSLTEKWSDSLQGSLMDYHSFSCRDSFDVPSHIREIIDNVILISGEEIKHWEKNYIQAMMYAIPLESPTRLVKIFIKSLDRIALKSDGTFNFKGCVENILMSRKLRRTEEFAISCLYCLENYVREIWPLVSEMLIAFNNPPLIVYWEKILNNVAIEESFVRDLLSASVSARNWLAFEYLWEKLTEESQTREAIAIIRDHDSYSIKRVLFKLNEKQIREISAENGHYLFKRLLEMQHYEYYEYATKFWHFVKNSIGAEVFSKIVKLLWNAVFNPSNYLISRIHQNNQLLFEIWLDAPSTLKSSFAFANELFATLDSNVRGVHHYDLTFIFELLENTNYSYQTKEKLWRYYWPRLIIRAKSSDLEKLMKLCFSNRDEIQQFIENVETTLDASLRYYFTGCVNSGLYSELYDCLNFFTEKPNRLETLSKKIIVSNLNLIVSYSYDDDKLAKCYAFIKSTFRDERAADKFLEEMILNPECLSSIYKKLANGRFDNVISLYSRFLTSSQRLREIKQRFMAYCCGEFARGRITGFDETRFNEFSSWCSLEEEKISQYKKSLVIDDIFEIVLNNFMQVLSRGSDESSLVYLDEFLRWYFGSSEQAKLYKSKKLSNYNEWPAIRTNLIVCGRRVPEIVDMLLLWGFENDKNKANEVRLSLYRDSLQMTLPEKFL